MGNEWRPVRGAEGYRLSPAAGRLTVTDADGREVYGRSDLPAGTEITFDEETIRIAAR